MVLTPEAFAAFLGILVAILTALIAGIARMEHRFTRLETMIMNLKEDTVELETRGEKDGTRLTRLEQKVGHIARAKSIVPDREAGGGG